MADMRLNDLFNVKRLLELVYRLVKFVYLINNINEIKKIGYMVFVMFLLLLEHFLEILIFRVVAIFRILCVDILWLSGCLGKKDIFLNI